MTATSLDLSQIKTDALSAASTFRTLIGLGTLATQSPTGTPSASNFLRGDFSWQTIDLTGYVPYTGATANLDLGSYTLSAKNATIAGGTVTTSTPVLNLTQTWNASGTTFTGILANITDTASNASSLLMDLQVGGSSKFKVEKGGQIRAPSLLFGAAGNNDFGIFHDGYSIYLSTNYQDVVFRYVTTHILRVALNAVGMPSPTELFWTDRQSGYYGFKDLVLARDAANTLAQRNGASAQTYRLYNTYTSSTSFENLQLQWASNEARIGTSVGATAGTQRDLVFGSWAANGTWSSLLALPAAGNLIEQRNSTTAQTFRIYNTYSSDTSYERGVLRWNSNVFEIGTEKAGTGTARKVRIISGDYSSYLDIDNAGYGTRLIAQYGLGLQSNIDTRKSVTFGDLSSPGNPVIGNESFAFTRRCIADKMLGFDPYHSNHDFEVGRIPNLTIRGHDCYASAVTNIAGGHLYLIPGAGASGSAGAANGGHVYLDGGRGYGTGVDGSIIIGSTRGNLQITDARNVVLGNTTGTKIGTATNQKIGFWNATPIVQPDTTVAAATVVAGSGTAVTEDSTFDGYTLAKIVKALRNAGILA